MEEYHKLRETERITQQSVDEETASLYEEGYSTDEVIDVIGWSKAGLSSWRHRRGLYLKQNRTHYAFDEDEAWAKFEAGMATGKLATLYGVDRIAIVRALKKMNPRRYAEIASKRKGGRKHGARIGNSWNVQEAWAQYLVGDTLQAIGKRYGKSALTIRAGFLVHYPDEYRALAAERLAEHRDRGRRWATMEPYSRK